jgi:hypothetical protein
MRRPRILCAIGLAVSSAAITAGQTAPAAPPSEALRTHVKNERFDVVTSIRGLPLGVRDELQGLWDSRTLDIAEPGTEFQGSGATVNASLPARRLVAAGCSADYHCLVYYERGGRSHTWLVALFRWTPAATRLEGGGTAPGGLKTIDAVQSAVVSGAIKQNGSW